MTEGNDRVPSDGPQTTGQGQVLSMAGHRTWRAWDTFAWSLGAAFFAFLAFLGAALWLRLKGELNVGQSEALLGLLRYGTYPLVFLALGALLWHLVRFYRGDYARR